MVRALEIIIQILWKGFIMLYVNFVKSQSVPYTIGDNI